MEKKFQHPEPVSYTHLDVYKRQKFTRMLLSKLAKGVLHKKLGYDIDIQLNELNASISDEKAHVHVSIDADMSKEELMKILKKVGLN